VVDDGHGATSFGSGVLVDVREQYGLVVTNWHVVRDAQGDIEVHFPDGFESLGRALKVDPDWDLAAIVIWRPKVKPARVASQAPRTGDPLTICGYGPGIYRALAGRCTGYYAPRADLPEHMVELDVEARQGDSGGPIFNAHGELAGVLFGAGDGTTLGSFAGRVGSFLGTLAPDIGIPSSTGGNTLAAAGAGGRRSAATGAGEALVADQGPSQLAGPWSEGPTSQLPRPSDTLRVAATMERPENPAAPSVREEAGWESVSGGSPTTGGDLPSARLSAPTLSAPGQSPPFSTPGVTSTLPATRGSAGWFDQLKTVLAAIGVVAIVKQALRVVG
jgi:hypothetical protein